jgi:TRAP-type C4-dicarboxylate transport system permease small subunit
MSAPSQTSQREWGPADRLARILTGSAAITLFALMVITCIDVFGRYLFNSPLPGGTELTEIGLAILIFACIPVISWRDEHIVVDLLDGFFGQTARRIRTILINLLIAGCLGFLGERIYVLGERALEYGEVTEYLQLPTGYLTIFIAAMCWFTAALLVTYGIFRALRQA